jgi:hypothetical protein
MKKVNCRVPCCPLNGGKIFCKPPDLDLDLDCYYENDFFKSFFSKNNQRNSLLFSCSYLSIGCPLNAQLANFFIAMRNGNRQCKIKNQLCL